MTTSRAKKSSSNEMAGITPGADLMRAAYVLGRNLHLLSGWLESVAEIARDRPVRPWQWDHPYTLFGASFDIWPEHLYDEIDEALQTLVLAQIVDHAALSEMRRLLDIVCDDCRDVAEFTAYDLTEEIYETHWHARRNLSLAEEFSICLLKDSPDRLAALRRLGSQIGSLLNRLVHFPDCESELSLLFRTTALGEELFSPATPQLASLKNAIPASPAASLALEWASCRFIVDCLQNLDRWIVEQSSAPEISVEPFIVLDDQNETLTYFGVEIPFAVFGEENALGGLEILRVLIRRPGWPMSAREIFEESTSSADPQQISAYLARFRRVLKQTRSYWPHHILQQKETDKAAKRGFIKSDRIARNQASSNDSWYKLDLPPFRVRYVPFGLI